MALKQYQVPIVFYIEEEKEEDASLMADSIADIIYRQYGYDSAIGKVEERD